MRKSVTVVSNVESPVLSNYLTNVGFRVRVADSPEIAGQGGSLVWLNPADDANAIVDAIRSWLKANARTRVVIVTERPTHIRAAVLDLRGRVRVLPAPAFAGKWSMRSGRMAARN